MAKNVKVLIDIPEDIYIRLKAGDTNAGNTLHDTALTSIANGMILQKSIVVMPNGASAYITQGHIDAMIVYEREQHIKEICDRMKHNLDGINDVDLPKHVPLVTPEETKRQFGLEDNKNG